MEAIYVAAFLPLAGIGGLIGYLLFDNIKHTKKHALKPGGLEQKVAEEHIKPALTADTSAPKPQYPLLRTPNSNLYK